MNKANYTSSGKEKNKVMNEWMNKWMLRKARKVHVGQVENAEVRKRKYGNGITETEVQKWEEKLPVGV